MNGGHARLAIAGLVLAAALTGCRQANVATGPGVGNARSVSLAEFSRAADAEPSESNADADTSGSSESERAASIRLEAGTRPQSEPIGRASGRQPMQNVEPGSRFIVDSLIGQVNGRPIFAGEFFDEWDDRLRQESRQMSRSEFEQYLQTQIYQWLENVVINELVLSEAESNLTRDMRQGLFAWLRELEEERIARAGGSRAQAERELAEQDQTLEEYLQSIRDQQLMSRIVREQIDNRVIVSWRDIQRAYERHRDRYMPPATVTLYRLSLHNNRDAERIETVTQRLDAGEPFLEIADDLGYDESDLHFRDMTLDEDGRLVGLRSDFNDAIPAFEAGAISEPIDLGSSTMWLYVADVDQPDGRSLYDRDVQRELANELYNRRSRREQQRYLNSLMAEGGQDELNAMTERLYRIAEQRYLP